MKRFVFYPFLIFLFIINSNLAHAQCPTAAETLTNGKCIYLSWDTPPSPLPMSYTSDLKTYTFLSGAGTTGSPAIYKNGQNCNGGSPGSFTGTISNGGEDCIFAAGALPISLISFSAIPSEKRITLFWETASETNNSEFIVQKSGNGTNWEDLASLNGAGTSIELNQYEIVDYNPISGSNFYRLKQIDFDGHFEYSIPVSAQFGNEIASFTVYPNPAESTFRLSFQEGFDIESVSLYNQLGQSIPLKISSEFEIEVSSLPRGNYFLKAVSGRTEITGKVFLK